jgi:hypothetical protein
MATAKREATNFLRKWSTPFPVSEQAHARDGQRQAGRDVAVRNLQGYGDTGALQRLGAERRSARQAAGIEENQYGEKHPTNPCQNKVIDQDA